MARLRNPDDSSRGPGSEVLTLLRTKALRKVPYRSRQAGAIGGFASGGGAPGYRQDRRMKRESSTALPKEGSMTTATRLGKILSRLSSGAIASIGLLALSAGSQSAMAQNHGSAALTGTVSSPQEGKMEGVVVSAKRPGSTIMVSVSTNAQGQYSFPEGRLAPGAYDITMRAIGYTLKPTVATIQSGDATQLDLKLAKAGKEVL